MSIIDTDATKKLLWIIVLAFLIRVVLPVVSYKISRNKDIFYAPDSRVYVDLAKELMQTGNFARGDKPEVKRTPGYPVFLTSGIFFGELEGIVIFLQILLSCITVFLVYEIVLRIFNESSCALLGAILYSLEPLSIVFSSIILTETLFTFLITAFLFFIIRYIQDQKFGDLVISAFLLSVSIYVRPASYYLVIPVSLFIAIIGYYKRIIFKKFISQTATFFLICVLLLGIWHIRNLKVSGYSGFSAIDAVYLYFYNGAAIEARKDNRPYNQVQKERGYGKLEAYFLRHPEQTSWSESERLRFMKREGLKEIRENLDVYMPVHLKGIIRVIFDPGGVYYLKLLSLYPKQGGVLGMILDRGLFATVKDLIKNYPLLFWINLILGILLVFQLIFALSVLFYKNSGQTAILFIIGIIVYFLLVSGGPNSIARLRHPIMPVICILASFGMERVLFRKNKM